MARMRRPLGAAGFGIAACVLLFVVAAVSCASPTQIVVEVFTDACPGSGKPEVVSSTGIAVGTVANIEGQGVASLHDGCESATGVGTLTIYPSGANDEEVAVKVLGGVEITPDQCRAPGYAGCIVNRRTVRFVPHTTQRVTVVLSLACLNRDCPGTLTCDNGACVKPADILADGGTSADAERLESGAVDAVAVTDAATLDATTNTCPGCKGTCAGGKCVVDCSNPLAPCTGELCSNGLPCEIDCRKNGACKSISCTTRDASCVIHCTDTNACQGGIVCSAAGTGSCDVNCDHDFACNGSFPISVSADTATIECKGDSACRLATISCNALTSCSLMCGTKNGINASCNQIMKPSCTSDSCTGDFP